MKAATLSIRIWIPKGKRRELPDDLDEAFQPHAERVAHMLEQGYTSGEIIGEGHSGWWEISEDSK
jgi:hypothetical protein